LSFSSIVKEELSRLSDTRICCKNSELSALLRSGLCFRNVDKNLKLMFISENALLARHLFSAVKESFHSVPEVVMQKTHRLKDHTIYQLDFTALSEGVGKTFLAVQYGILIENGVIRYRPWQFKKRCCKRAYLRGCFLASGSVSDPDRAYHLEITFPDRILLLDFQQALAFYHIMAKDIERKGKFLAYLKEAQEIVDFLNIIGAHTALMKMENIRILKDVRNGVNRIVNCETANLEKTVNASIRQIDKIYYLADHIGLESLPDGLREVAMLRLQHSEVSIQELGEMLSPPLTKSGVNHRLRKLEQLADRVPAT